MRKLSGGCGLLSKRCGEVVESVLGGCLEGVGRLSRVFGEAV